MVKRFEPKKVKHASEARHLREEQDEKRWSKHPDSLVDDLLGDEDAADLELQDYLADVLGGDW